MCHHANTHGTQPYVALKNLHILAGVGQYSVERELSPNLSQSPHSVCHACRQPRFLMRPPQLLCTHSSVFLCSQFKRGRVLVHHPTAPSHLYHLPLWLIWSHLLRADLCICCISASSWVTISTLCHSHFDD